MVSEYMLKSRHNKPRKLYSDPMFLLALFGFFLLSTSACGVKRATYLTALEKADLARKQLADEQLEMRELRQELSELDRKHQELQQAAPEQAEAQALRARAGAAEQRLQTQQATSAERDRALQESQRMLEEFRRQLATAQVALAERDRKVNESERMLAALRRQLGAEIKEGNVEATLVEGRISLRMLETILFSSGNNALSEHGKRVLDQVLGVLDKSGQDVIRIQGHTDTVPIGPRLLARFPTNWELSAARATRVVRYLEQHGVDPARLMAVGLSQYHPIASNADEAGRQQNRRIEITLSSEEVDVQKP